MNRILVRAGMVATAIILAWGAGHQSQSHSTNPPVWAVVAEDDQPACWITNEGTIVAGPASFIDQAEEVACW